MYFVYELLTYNDMCLNCMLGVWTISGVLDGLQDKLPFVSLLPLLAVTADCCLAPGGSLARFSTSLPSPSEQIYAAASLPCVTPRVEVLLLTTTWLASYLKVGKHPPSAAGNCVCPTSEFGRLICDPILFSAT